MTFQPGAMLYTQAFGSRPENVEVPVYATRDPNSNDILYPLAKRWLNTVSGSLFYLSKLSSSGGIITPTWTLVSLSTGGIQSVTTDDATVVVPTAGNINLAGSGSIATTGSVSTATVALTGLTNHALLVGAGTSTITKLALGTANQLLASGGASADPAWTTATYPLTVTAGSLLVATAANVIGQIADVATGQLLASGGVGVIPSYTGSPSVSGSLTAGTTITATLGNITATNGNIVLGTLGNKFIVPTGTNASAGTSAAMSGTPGVVTVATTACSSTALVFYSRKTTGGTPGQVSITAQDGTGFTLTSTGNETSTFNWWIINA